MIRIIYSLLALLVHANGRFYMIDAIRTSATTMNIDADVTDHMDHDYSHSVDHWLRAYSSTRNGWKFAGVFITLQAVHLLSIVLFVRHRHLPEIYHRNVPLTISFVITSNIVLSWCIIRILFRHPLDCTLELWLGATMLLIALLMVMGRYIRLLVYFLCCETHLQLSESARRERHWTSSDQQPNEKIEFLRGHHLYNCFVQLIRWSDRLRYRTPSRHADQMNGNTTTRSTATVSTTDMGSSADDIASSARNSTATARAPVYNDSIHSRIADEMSESAIGNGNPMNSGAGSTPRIVARNQLRTQSTRPSRKRMRSNSGSQATISYGKPTTTSLSALELSSNNTNRLSSEVQSWNASSSESVQPDQTSRVTMNRGEVLRESSVQLFGNHSLEEIDKIIAIPISIPAINVTRTKSTNEHEDEDIVDDAQLHAKQQSTSLDTLFNVPVSNESISPDSPPISRKKRILAIPSTSSQTSTLLHSQHRNDTSTLLHGRSSLSPSNPTSFMSTVASLDEHSNEAANPGGIQRVRRSTLASLISSSIGSTLFEHQPDSFNEFSPCIVLGSWYWRHRERQSFGAVSLLLTALILVVLVFTSIIYVIAYETNSLLATKEISICLTRWPFWPACIACTLCQLVLMPMIYRKIPKTQNGFGMRVELLLLTLGGATVYLFILITLIAIPQRMRYIRTLCLICPIVFYLLYVHVCTVLYPVIKARRTKRQQERSHDALSWAAFEALLANPIRFKRFKQFSKRDYSSENAIFYEHCRRLRNNALSLERTLLDRELRHIWYTFIETSAPLQIHLDANTTTRIRQHIFNGGQLCTDVRILDTALLEVCELMYQHTYPRFVAWETANQHCSPSDEPV